MSTELEIDAVSITLSFVQGLQTAKRLSGAQDEANRSHVGAQLSEREEKIEKEICKQK